MESTAAALRNANRELYIEEARGASGRLRGHRNARAKAIIWVRSTLVIVWLLHWASVIGYGCNSQVHTLPEVLSSRNERVGHGEDIDDDEDRYNKPRYE